MGIISLDVTSIELVIMILFGYVFNVFWDQLSG